VLVDGPQTGAVGAQRGGGHPQVLERRVGVLEPGVERHVGVGHGVVCLVDNQVVHRPGGQQAGQTFLVGERLHRGDRDLGVALVVLGHDHPDLAVPFGVVGDQAVAGLLDQFFGVGDDQRTLPGLERLVEQGEEHGRLAAPGGQHHQRVGVVLGPGGLDGLDGALLVISELKHGLCNPSFFLPLV